MLPEEKPVNNSQKHSVKTNQSSCLWIRFLFWTVLINQGRTNDPWNDEYEPGDDAEEPTDSNIKDWQRYHERSGTNQSFQMLESFREG